VRGPRRWSSAALLIGALAAWALGWRSVDAPSGSESGAEASPAEGGAPALLGHPRVTSGERAPGADPEAPGGDDAAPSTGDVAPQPLPVEIVVLDGSGDPIAGAQVEVPLHRTQTDAEGRARLPPWGYDTGMPSHDRYWKTVRVRASGFVPVAYLGGRSQEVIRLDALSGHVAGCCTDTDGRPIADVTLALTWFQSSATLETIAVTAGDGRFTFPDAPWTRARIRVRGTTWSADPVDVVPPEGDVRLVLRPAETLEPRVPTRIPDDPTPQDADPHAPWVEVDAAGVEGRYLHAIAVTQDGAAHDLGWLDAGKVVRFAVPSEDLTALLLTSDGSVGWRQPAAVRTSGRLRCPATAPVRLRLADARGRRVEDGTVSVRWTDVGRIATSGERAPRLGGRSEGDAALEPGQHVVQNVAPGTFDLVWRNGAHPGVVLLRRGIVMPDPPVPLDVGDVVLPSPVAFDVLVVDAAGPVAGAVVRYVSPGEDVFARTDRDGVCRLSVRDPADPVVEAVHPERGSGRLRLAGDDLRGRVTVVVRRPESAAAAAGR
jgi:hypothetical protein